MISPFGTVSFEYQILVNTLCGEHWKTIDPKIPLFEQTRHMLSYRALDRKGKIVKIVKRFQPTLTF